MLIADLLGADRLTIGTLNGSGLRTPYDHSELMPYSTERTKESKKPAAVLSATVGPPCS